MNGVNKSSWYLLQRYYVASAKNTQLVEETALLLRISTFHIVMSVVPQCPCFRVAVLLPTNLENKQECYLLGLFWHIPIARYVHSSLNILH